MRINLTVAEVLHLLNILDEKIEDGSYYGDPARYYERSLRIQERIRDALKAEDESRRVSRSIQAEDESRRTSKE